MIETPLNVLAFFAHPDDETMLCGGTLALLAQLGAQVHVLVATRGEGGEMGNPPLTTREQLGAVREAELRCAVEALGVKSLILFDYADPLVGADDRLYPFTEDEDTLTQELLKTIARTGAVALLSHGANGEYGHPAHQLVHRTAARAIADLGDRAPLFYGVMGFFEGHPFPRLLNPDAPADLIIDVGSVLQQKIAAALCHRTQHDLFIRRRSEEAGRTLSVPEVVLPIESLTRVFPPVENRPDDPLARLLLSSGLARVP